MILVDTSVWIDFFRNNPTPEAEWLDRNLDAERLVVGDLVLAEVLSRCATASTEARALRPTPARGAAPSPFGDDGELLGVGWR